MYFLNRNTKLLVQYGNTDDFFTCFTAIQVITEEVQVQVVTEDLLLCEVQFHKCHKEMCAAQLIRKLQDLTNSM